MRAFEMRVDFVGGFLGGVHADLGVSAGAQTLGDGLAQLDAAVGLGERQMLGIGVGDDELDPFEACVDHVVDGVAACPADAEDDDTGFQFSGLWPHQRESRHDFRSDLPTLPPYGHCEIPADSQWLTGKLRKTPIPLREGYRLA